MDHGQWTMDKFGLRKAEAMMVHGTWYVVH
jgi:hypothetical protein